MLSIVVAAVPAPVPALDGRHRRREENREAVIDALVALWDDGRYQTSAAEVAERAGISPRSLFRYFDDLGDLTRAAIERHLQAAAPLFDIPIDASEPTAAKIAAVVDCRLRLWDAIEASARAGRATAHRNPIVAERLHDARRSFCDQVRTLFAPELADRPDALGPVDVLLSFESRELLRVEHRLGADRTRHSLVAALTALLER
jgi:TetR/AcrR family transcriptional regulator of autoinduction and epiphytic fitness